MGALRWTSNGAPEKRKRTSGNTASLLTKRATVFGDPLALTFEDLDHSLVEQRYLTFGIRMTARERRQYEQYEQR